MIFTGDGPGFTGVRHGITFEGPDGWVWVNRGAIEAEPKSLLKEPFGPDEIRLPVSTFHQGNFLECVRTRQKTICNIDVAVRSDTVCQLAWCAFHLQRKLRWDPDQEVVRQRPRCQPQADSALACAVASVNADARLRSIVPVFCLVACAGSGITCHSHEKANCHHC